MSRSSPAAIALMLRFEGVDQPWLWPGEDSGISIGRGYDLGFEKHFVSDWSDKIPNGHIHALSTAIGLHGEAAHRLAPTFHGMHISTDAADQVFSECTLPQEEASCLATFPGSERLPPDAFGALVSLGYNRGWSLVDRPHAHSRAEMRGIAAILRRPVDRDTLDNIADLIVCMVAYWPDQHTGSDLFARRKAEASLVRNAQWPKAPALVLPGPTDHAPLNSGA